MKVFPMIFRFVLRVDYSLQFDEKTIRRVHDPDIEGYPSVKRVRISSTSPLRRPLSTKMAFIRSPMARCSRAAATDESTPPESPQITFSSPTISLIVATDSSMKRPIVHPLCRRRRRTGNF